MRFRLEGFFALALSAIPLAGAWWLGWSIYTAMTLIWIEVALSSYALAWRIDRIARKLEATPSPGLREHESLLLEQLLDGRSARKARDFATVLAVVYGVMLVAMPWYETWQSPTLPRWSVDPWDLSWGIGFVVLGLVVEMASRSRVAAPTTLVGVDDALTGRVLQVVLFPVAMGIANFANRDEGAPWILEYPLVFLACAVVVRSVPEFFGSAVAPVRSS